MNSVSAMLISECRRRLLEHKSEILNRLIDSRKEFSALDKGSDEADQSMTLLAENEFLATQNLLKSRLLEVEMALARIERGTYGVCEETQEPIEPARLRAIPWTRLSIEGAEIREALTRRYAK